MTATYVQNYSERRADVLSLPGDRGEPVFNRRTPFERKTLEGKPHLVMPVVMIAGHPSDGMVMAGSGGPILYPPEETKRTAHLWNGRPIVRDHPNLHGVSSANEPAAFSAQRVGTVFNARYEDGRLVAEAWIDIGRAEAVDRRIMQMLNARRSIEVSTGLYTDNVASVGVVNGRSYQAVASNYRPDHLAILLDTKGACSLDDGCGLLRRTDAARSSADYSGRIAGNASRIKPLGLPTLGNPGNPLYPRSLQ